MPLQIETRRGEDLTAAELYAVLRLRVDVFVVEQRAPYADLDGQDLDPGTVHLWAHDDGDVLACVRALRSASTEPAIGRVATAPAARGRGIAGDLIERGIALCRPDATIHLDAQSHLESWYGRFGFTRTGDDHDEDGIPHVWMVRTPRTA